MGTIVERQDASPDNNEETNNVPLEEEMHQQMNLIKLEDLNIVLLEEIRRKMNLKNMVKWCLIVTLMKLEKNLIKTKSNLVNNVILKLEEFDKFSKRKFHFIITPRYVPTDRTTN